MATFAALVLDVREVVNDNIAPYTVADGLLLRYGNAALQWVATRHPQILYSEDMVVTAGLATLPGLCIRPLAIYADGNTLLNEKQLTESGPKPKRNEWVRLQRDTVAIGGTVSTVSIAYESYYTALTDEESEITLAPRLEDALFHFVCARALAQRAVGSANLDQFDTRIDAGNPEHNPLARMAKDYMREAERILLSYAQE